VAGYDEIIRPVAYYQSPCLAPGELNWKSDDIPGSNVKAAMNSWNFA